MDCICEVRRPILWDSQNLYGLVDNQDLAPMHLGKMGKKVGVVLQFSGIEAHSSVENVDRYNQPLRTIFNIVCSAQPSLDDHLNLIISIQAINDTMGRNCVVNVLLVFGVVHSFSATSECATFQAQNFRALRMKDLAFEARIRTALNTKIPPATRYLLTPGDKLRVYRGKRRTMNRPFHVARVSDKIISVKEGIWLNLFNSPHVQAMTPRSNDPDLKEDMTKTEKYLKYFSYKLL